MQDSAGEGLTTLAAIAALPWWPEDAAIDLFHSGPTMGAIRFSDASVYVEALAAEIDRRAAQRAQAEPIAGGAFKLAEAEHWRSPASRLVHERALRLLTSMLNRGEVRLMECAAYVVPPQRCLPLRAAPGAHASVTALLRGQGLYLQHERIHGVRAAAPGREAGLMLAHPSTMRPCLIENLESDAALLMSWDYVPA